MSKYDATGWRKLAKRYGYAWIAECMKRQGISCDEAIKLLFR